MQRDTRDVHTERKATGRLSEKVATSKPRRGSRLCGHLGLGLSASRDVRSTCLLFKKHSLWNFVMALLGNECTRMQSIERGHLTG